MGLCHSTDQDQRRTQGKSVPLRKILHQLPQPVDSILDAYVTVDSTQKFVMFYGKKWVSEKNQKQKEEVKNQQLQNNEAAEIYQISIYTLPDLVFVYEGEVLETMPRGLMDLICSKNSLYFLPNNLGAYHRLNLDTKVCDTCSLIPNMDIGELIVNTVNSELDLAYYIFKSKSNLQIHSMHKLSTGETIFQTEENFSGEIIKKTLLTQESFVYMVVEKEGKYHLVQIDSTGKKTFLNNFEETPSSLSIILQSNKSVAYLYFINNLVYYYDTEIGRLISYSTGEEILSIQSTSNYDFIKCTTTQGNVILMNITNGETKEEKKTNLNVGPHLKVQYQYNCKKTSNFRIVVYKNGLVISENESNLKYLLPPGDVLNAQQIDLNTIVFVTSWGICYYSLSKDSVYEVKYFYEIHAVDISHDEKLIGFAYVGLKGTKTVAIWSMTDKKLILDVEVESIESNVTSLNVINEKSLCMFANKRLYVVESGKPNIEISFAVEVQDILYIPSSKHIICLSNAKKLFSVNVETKGIAPMNFEFMATTTLVKVQTDAQRDNLFVIEYGNGTQVVTYVQLAQDTRVKGQQITEEESYLVVNNNQSYLVSNLVKNVGGGKTSKETSILRQDLATKKTEKIVISYMGEIKNISYTTKDSLYVIMSAQAVGFVKI